MRNSTLTNSGSSGSEAPQDMGFSPWQRLQSKRISYLVLPLIIMATMTEFVILATGWKYQKIVCLPQGMGVTFFGIGPIGATILAVELLKLPLAIWTASRQGWQKGFMIMVGLPLICVLTFQLVKDMAVYEMGVAMTPASQMLEKATTEEVRINQLNADLAAIEGKRKARDQRLAELAATQAKAKSELAESIKRNEEARQDAISLTDYQKKELSEVEARQATIIQQFNSDTEQLTKAIADLRARREAEFARSFKDSKDWETRKGAYDAAYSKWHTEEARIDNVYQTAMADYANKKAAYEKDKAEYAAAGFLKRQLMKEPVDPGVAPVREVNKFTKPADLDGRPAALIAEIDEQIKSKEAELQVVNNKRRERVAQVDADARRLRAEFDQRSTTKREESDRKREELSAALAGLAKEEKSEHEQIDKEYESVVQKVDGIRAEIDACRKRAEGFYEAREAAIRKTQVHRIATTVEIVRGLIKGERPVSIKATAKERGDLLTDQISMVRIFVYPVLAFIVAFLPTLMVEIGFSTVFMPEQQRPPYRLGFFGRHLHWLYIRAGRQKILRAERIASEASTEIAVRDRALAEARAQTDKALFDKDAELQNAREAMSAASAAHQEQVQRIEEEHTEQTKKKEAEWMAKLAATTDSLNRTVVEKDALRDLQKSEIERQIQMRQNAWSDRLTQLRQELDEQRAAGEAERLAMMQDHHKKLMEVSEDCKTQVIQVRRQMADAELAAVEKSAKLAHDLKEALHARDEAEAQLKHQADTFSVKLAQGQEDAAREREKAARQDKHHLERQQLEFEKALRQRDEGFAHRLKQREQELSLAFEARLADEKNNVEQSARRREAELERQFEARALEVDARWKQEAHQREDAIQIRLKQQEQQLLAQAEVRLGELQTQAEQEFRRRQSEFERQLEAQSREADARLKQELQQKEVVFQAKVKQREQELAARTNARENELQNQSAADLRARQEEWERQADGRLGELQTQAEQEFRRRQSEFERQLEAQSREADARLKQELQQKEMAFQARLKQREQELAIRGNAREVELQNQSVADLRARQEEWERQTEARLSEMHTQVEQELRSRQVEFERQLEAQSREADARLKQESQQKDLAFQAKLKQREQELVIKAGTRETELQSQWAADLRARQEEWERQAESRLRATETRFGHEAQQKEELFLSRSRQRDQQWQAKLDTLRAELQSQTEALRRREVEADARLRELEAQLRKEMQEKEEGAQSQARQREQDLVSQLTAQAEARHVAARSQWETESENKTRAAIEPFKTMLTRTEKERDEARESASENARQVQSLEKRLTEASTFLNTWRNGKNLAGAA
jgi:hypothetical protein